MFVGLVIPNFLMFKTDAAYKHHYLPLPKYIRPLKDQAFQEVLY